jgi:hypothetical protein
MANRVECHSHQSTRPKILLVENSGGQHAMKIILTGLSIGFICISLGVCSYLIHAGLAKSQPIEININLRLPMKDPK